ncbi:unnamed protein product [Brassica oleracea var. botrytis]
MQACVVNSSYVFDQSHSWSNKCLCLDEDSISFCI